MTIILGRLFFNILSDTLGYEHDRKSAMNEMKTSLNPAYFLISTPDHYEK